MKELRAGVSCDLMAALSDERRAVPRSGSTIGNVWKMLGVSVPNAEMTEYMQTFLVFGVGTILLTRLYLQLTGFPKIGGGSGLHFAHMLIGGALMTVTIVLLFAFLGRQVRSFASLLGGIGFGLFIDELGKFITSDNNYFFQPTIALIYVVFVGLFFWLHSIQREQLSPSAQLVNAANMLENALVSGASRRDVTRAVNYLERSGIEGQLADGLRLALTSVARTRHEVRSPVVWSAARAWRLYDRLTRWPAFSQLAPGLFVLHGLIGVGFAVAVGVPTLRAQPGLGASVDLDRQIALVGAAVALLVLALVGLGVALFGRSRRDAYRWFEWAVLVSIFFGQLSLFWLAELAATSMLAWDLVLLGVVRFLIRQETGRTALSRVRDARNQAVLAALDSH
jgi:hypothetical protein